MSAKYIKNLELLQNKSNLKNINIKKFKPSILISKFAVVIYNIIFNTLDVILHQVLLRGKLSRTIPYSFGCLILDACIIWILISERINEKREIANKKWTKYMRFIKYFRYLVWTFLFIIIILKVVILASGKSIHQLKINESKKSAYVIVFVICTVIDIALLSFWWEEKLKSVYALFTGIQLVQILFAIAIIQINLNLINVYPGSSIKRVHNLYIFTSCFCISQAVYGAILGGVLNEENRLNELMGKMLTLSNIFQGLLLTLVTICFITMLCFSNSLLNSYGDIPASLPIIYGCVIILGLMSLACTRYFRRRKPITDLVVEEYDLSALTPQQKAGWSKLINLNYRYNSGISGEAIISLMENYSNNSTIDGVRFKILRVFKSCNSGEEINSEKEGAEMDNNNNNNNNNNKNNKKNANADLEKNPSIPEPKSLRKSYDNTAVSKAWESFDKESVVFSHTVETSSSSEQSLDEFKPLSKNQLKRLAKKKSKQQKMEDIEELQKNSVKFYNDLKCTEALTLLTIIDSFDLAERIPGKIGEYLSKWFGRNSKYPILCIKFGLLGFHWPFKRSTVYCSSTRKPVARSAAVMYSINEWNKTNEKCTVLLDPTYKDDFSEPGIGLSGWYKINLPNSHVIDLRPYMNKTIDQYYKAVKYRNHDNVFREEHGEVVETFEFNESNCEEVITLNQFISQSRTSTGQSDTLIKPHWKFVSHLGNFSNENKYRSIVFLKVNGQLVASCVIFRLGDTITSDIQGLNHEVSKKYRAYFVMMQEVIKIALREKVSFVDFGPTTENAKVDIGCKVVPLVGSLSARNPVLSPIIRLAAANVSV
ncbi:uncharacterized protein RJT21DRAFT_121745 [Scheffersomyces amazonensis]|uniref:uncharacterized protein n=1 Tax=Scheffersomyces amazonensis TaxID=1078765 RepID=UPI00315CDDB2